MHIAPDTIRAAFHMHGVIYHQGRRGWNIPYHVDCWARAAGAFDHGSFDDFQWLYLELRNKWKVFRSPRRIETWSAEVLFERLRLLDAAWCARRLRDLSDDDMPGCLSIVESLADLKRTAQGPSVMALSKFLHFWNPRCFVIVDDAVMYRWVLSHHWLRSSLTPTRDRVGSLLDITCRLSESCDVLSYLAILRWCADIVRDNPEVGTTFPEHVRLHDAHRPKLDLPLKQYDAAAVEWFLLGLVEVPPPGICLQACTGSEPSK